MASQKTFGIQEYRNNEFRRTTVQAIREAPLRILLNGREVITLLCTGLHPEFLAAGYLFSCGLIGGADDIKQLSLTESDSEIEVRVELSVGAADARGVTVTSGLGRVVRTARAGRVALAKPEVPWLDPQDVLRMAKELHARSELYRQTRGCHNSSLCTPRRMLLFRSDIGRHNAIDTLVGQLLLERLPVEGMFLMTTGRIASEIVHKAARAGVGVLASTAVATALAAETAAQDGLTLIGNVTEESFWVYNDPGRLISK